MTTRFPCLRLREDVSASPQGVLSAGVRRYSDDVGVGESLHVQAPSAVSALLLRHRLNELNLDAIVMPDGDAWDVRVRVADEISAAAVRRVIEEVAGAPPVATRP